jgi:hypothetical protein
MSKSGPCSLDEVLALGLILPPKSKSTTQSREVQFDIVVTKATRLIGPHKTRHAVSTQLKACHRGQNDVVLNWHRQGLQPWNLRIATALSRPSLPAEPLSPNCPARSHPQYKNINQTSTHQISINPSGSWKEGFLHSSGTYHWTSTGDNQLCLAHLVVKDKHIYNKVISRRVLSSNLLPSSNNPICNAHYITWIE